MGRRLVFSVLSIKAGMDWVRMDGMGQVGASDGVFRAGLHLEGLIGLCRRLCCWMDGWVDG